MGKAESGKRKGSSCSGHLIQKFGVTVCLIGALSGKWGWGWRGRMGVRMEANGMFSWFAAPFCLECLSCFVTSFLYALLPSPLQQTDCADSAATWLTPSLLHLSRYLEIWEFTVNPHDMKLRGGGQLWLWNPQDHFKRSVLWDHLENNKVCDNVTVFK